LNSRAEAGQDALTNRLSRGHRFTGSLSPLELLVDQPEGDSNRVAGADAGVGRGLLEPAERVLELVEG
jgi:hypothetical protein